MLEKNAIYRAIDGNWIASSIRRHKSIGIEICTTQEELIKCNDINHCAICGNTLIIAKNKKNHSSPTLDRKNNERYMDKYNTQIICSACNSIKGARTMNQFLEWCKMISAKKEFEIIKYNPTLIITPRKSPGREWAYSTYQNHIKKGYNIVATIDEIQNIYIQTKTCPMCGCKLESRKGKKGSQPCSPSLDDLHHLKGSGQAITIDDLWIICHGCNTHKHTLTFPHLKSYADKVCTKFKHLLTEENQVKMEE
jgi:hypothetical protein